MFGKSKWRYTFDLYVALCYFTVMENELKRIMCLNDLSFAGGSSLAAILPAIAAAGCEVLPVATALYSTHTGYDGAQRLCASDFAAKAVSHIAQSGIPVDAVYSGYLINKEAAEAVLAARRLFPNAMVVHDPAFADNGRLYSGMDGMVTVHRALLEGADLITPNMTEAQILCGREPKSDMTAGEAADLAAALPCRRKVITGATVGGVHCNLSAEDGVLTVIPFEKQPVSYPGTGDIFASLVTVMLLRGKKLSESVEKAAKIVLESIKYTNSISSDPRRGVAISQLVKEICKQL